MLSDDMYEWHTFTDGERQNVASMVCTSVVCTESKQLNAGSMVCTASNVWTVNNKWKPYGCRFVSVMEYAM